MRKEQMMSIIDDLRKDANEWIITLTEDERRAIKKIYL